MWQDDGYAPVVHVLYGGGAKVNEPVSVLGPHSEVVDDELVGLLHVKLARAQETYEPWRIRTTR